MAAQLMQLVEVLGGIKTTLDAGNMNDEVFAQVMKTLVDSTGTSLNMTKKGRGQQALAMSFVA